MRCKATRYLALVEFEVYLALVEFEVYLALVEFEILLCFINILIHFTTFEAVSFNMRNGESRRFRVTNGGCDIKTLANLN